jgi:hypothetical protein
LFLQDIPVAEDAGNQAKNQARKEHGEVEMLAAKRIRKATAKS